jgi:hypothetical protein
MGPIAWTETSVTNYHYTLRNIPEERKSRFHRSGSLKSSKKEEEENRRKKKGSSVHNSLKITGTHTFTHKRPGFVLQGSSFK